MTNNDWKIDHSCGRPVLVYQNCSVIQDEQAYFVLNLINNAATAPAGGVTPGAYLRKKAEDYAMEYGSDDMGGLSFGGGAHAEVKMDHYNNLLELAEELDALTTAARAAEPELRHVGWMVPINSKNHYIDGVRDPSDVLTDVQLPKLRKVFAALQSDQAQAGTEKP